MQVQQETEVRRAEPPRAAARRLWRVAADPRSTPAALALLCYALAFLQRPGLTYTDSRPELTTDPGLFLDRIASLWTTTADLGHVHSGQFVGYLLPMGPWFAGAKAAGIPLWIAERLWLGTLMAVAAWGAVRLMDALYERRRGIAHVVAGLLYAANPYVVVYISRSSVTLVAYCVLPWLLVAAHRGLGEPRRWRMPIAIGVLFALAGGGVNTAVVVPIAAAPVALLLYEVAVRDRTPRAALAFSWRTAVCVVVASTWWLVPVALQGLYAPQFLSFTEQPAALWATTSMSESLRLLGYWVVYFGSGFGATEPTTGVAGTYLFDKAVIVGCFAVPLVAFGGLRLTRRWRYAPFFVLLAVATLLVMSVGFPQAKPLGRALSSAYYDLGAIQILRTPYKAAPLLALSIACLGGASVAALVARARNAGLARDRLGRVVLAIAFAALAAVPVLWALPLFTGDAVDRKLAYGDIPKPWRAAMRDVDRTLGPNARAMALPGQLFGDYRWGMTTEPVAPTLAKRPVLARQITRYSDARSSQLQAVVDDTIQQQRLVPGQLPPLLRLLAVGQVVVATDGRPEQTGELAPALLARVLDAQPGFARPAATYGQTQTFAPSAGRSGAARALPQLRRYAGPRGGPGIVRVHPRARPTLIDGDADGIVQAAAHPGGLDPAAALFYAGDQNDRDLQRLVAAGARVVMTDSNRRRVIAASRISENRGPTVGPDDPIERDLASYDLFEHGSGDQTVALYGDLRYLRSPRSASFGIFPEYRPAAAFDGRLDRPWIAAAQKLSQRWIEVGLARPHAVASIQVHPHADALGRTAAIGVSVNGGAERVVELRAGWNTIRVDSPRLARLRLRVVRLTKVIFTGRGGLDEVRIPGVRADERLRLPTRLATRARGLDLAGSEIDVLLQRTTADAPYRAGSFVNDPQAENQLDMVDAEPGLKRRIVLPAARSFAVDGWASVAPDAPDPELDALAGVPANWSFTSSTRFEGVPGRRASSAFDGSTRTEWIGDWTPQRPAWIAVRAPRSFSVDQLRLRGNIGTEYLSPARVRVVTDAGATGALRVSGGGIVALPRRVRTRTLRIEVVQTVAPAGLSGARGLRGVAIAEVVVPGLAPPRPRRDGSFSTHCGSLAFWAGGATVRARVSGSIAQLDGGGPLRFATCGARRELPLAAGANDLDAPPGPLLRADHVRLVSPPTRPPSVATDATSPRVVAPGEQSNTSTSGVRLDVSGPSWLVLAQSYSKGWGAWCRDARGREHGLGEPRPIDGYANGWQIDAGCVKARFAFVPQRAATVAYWISGAGLLALLAALGVWVLRRRRGPGAAAAADGPPTLLAGEPPDPRRRLGWPAAISLAVALGAVGGFAFAMRAGAVLFVAALVLARVGVTVRRLLTCAAVAIAALPVLYVIHVPPDFGGFFFDYAYWYIDAHWVALAAVCALAVAGVLDAVRASSRG